MTARCVYVVTDVSMFIRVVTLVDVRARQHSPALTSYYSKQTNYMGIFTVSVCGVSVCARVLVHVVTHSYLAHLPYL